MNLSVGIVGLPNVGKSTLFNALLKKQQALAANYPFATIEPNVGIVAVPDDRLNKLAQITKAEEGMGNIPPIKPATVEFVDIAGLVKGASEGEGLGNKFLSHIREVKIAAHVVRAFEDANVIKEGAVDPKNDYITISTELALADLQTLENSKDKTNKDLIGRLIKILNDGGSISSLSFSREEAEFVKQLSLLSTKPEIIVLNVAENDYSNDKIEEVIKKYAVELDLPHEKMVVICAKIESELASLSEEDQGEYLADLGLEKSGLERLIQKAYEQLGLISFLTTGEKETRAWTIKKRSNAVEAAGEIHTDFMKKFIKAEVVSFDDFVEVGGPASPDEQASRGGWKRARDIGKMRLEGRDYIVQDGDVVEFKIGA